MHVRICRLITCLCAHPCEQKSRQSLRAVLLVKLGCFAAMASNLKQGALKHHSRSNLIKIADQVERFSPVQLIFVVQVIACLGRNQGPSSGRRARLCASLWASLGSSTASRLETAVVFACRSWGTGRQLR